MAGLLSASFLLSVPVYAQTEESSESTVTEATEQDDKISLETARELIRLTGTIQDADLVLEQSMKAFEGMPGLPPGFAENFKKEFDAEALNTEIAQLLVENVKPEAAKSAIEFFKTESGMVWVATMREVDQLAFQQSQELGQEIAMAILTGDAMPPMPERPKVAPDSDEAKLMAQLDMVLGLVHQNELVKVSIDKSLEAMADMPGLPEGFAEDMAKELSVERLSSITWPLMFERVDMALLNDVAIWAKKPGAQLYFTNVLTVLPLAMEKGQEAGRIAGEKAAMGG